MKSLTTISEFIKMITEAKQYIMAHETDPVKAHDAILKIDGLILELMKYNGNMVIDIQSYTTEWFLKKGKK